MSSMWEMIHKDKILFLLIDLQEKFYPILKESVIKNVRENILLMIKTFKVIDIPMIGTEHNVKGLGSTDSAVLSEWNGPSFTDKKTFSCYGNDAFKNNLTKFERELIVVAGLETHICVLQTVLDLLSNNYTVVVINDACLSSTKLKWKNGLELMKDFGAHILNTETLLFSLIKRVDTEIFKTFVNLLKEKNTKLAK